MWLDVFDIWDFSELSLCSIGALQFHRLVINPDQGPVTLCVKCWCMNGFPATTLDGLVNLKCT